MGTAQPSTVTAETTGRGKCWHPQSTKVPRLEGQSRGGSCLMSSTFSGVHIGWQTVQLKFKEGGAILKHLVGLKKSFKLFSFSITLFNYTLKSSFLVN